MSERSTRELAQHVQRELGRLTSTELGDVLGDRATSLVVLQPVGSQEPHGPHLGLSTDTLISQGACRRAAVALEEHGIAAFIAPAVPYGVTDCARQFPGAVSIPAEVLTAYLAAVVRAFLADGVAHVCLVNNHLEPAHDGAVRAAIEGFSGHQVSVACPLTRKWARTLSDEFKTGACHAGRYETSIVLAEDASYVRDDVRAALPEVPVSLSEQLRAGISDFAEMGLDRAYAGDPAAATAVEGDELLARLEAMIVGEVTAAVAQKPR